MIIKPPHIEKAETIGIIAPASEFDVLKFKIGIKVFSDFGYKIVYERCIFNKSWTQPHCGKKRAEQINNMFSDKKIKAILCAQAGYGSALAIPFLDVDVIRKNPKIFIGYSDITALLLFLHKMTGMVVFHGPIITDEIYEGMNPQTINFLNRIISIPKPLGIIKFHSIKAIKYGKARGKLVGGNLSLVVDSLKTDYEIDTDGKILFLEDIGENNQIVRQYLFSLKEAGKFAKVKGVVLGRMLKCFDDYSTFECMVKEVMADINVPIMFGFPSGHTKRGGLNITLPFGIQVEIDTSNLSIRIMQSAVT